MQDPDRTSCPSSRENQWRLVGPLLSLGLGLGGFALWIWLMLQAYLGREGALPGLAPHVRRLANETRGSARAEGLTPRLPGLSLGS
jgi:hypothetical protein